MAWLIPLMLLTPFLELFTFSAVWSTLSRDVGPLRGLLSALSLVVVGSYVGLAILRSRGPGIQARLQEEVAAGRPPGAALLDELAVLAAGVLLFVPGFLTDAVALVLLFRPTRWLFGRALAAWMVREVAAGHVRLDVHGFSVGTAPREPVDARSTVIETVGRRLDDPPGQDGKADRRDVPRIGMD